MCDQQCTIGSRLYFYDYTTVWNEWKQVTFVLHWTAITVYKIREVATHYLFTGSPENIFTLDFGSSGRVKQKQGRGETRKQKYAIAKEH